MWASIRQSRVTSSSAIARSPVFQRSSRNRRAISLSAGVVPSACRGGSGGWVSVSLLNQASSFRDVENTINRDVTESLHGLRGPAHRQLAGAAGFPETEMETQHALRGIAVAGRDLAGQRLPPGLEGDAGAHAVAVGLPARELDLQPVAPLPHLVAQQGVAVAVGGDGDVEHAAVPEVGEGDAAAVGQQVGARRAADLLEGAVPPVAEVAVALPAVPRELGEVFRIEEAARLVFLLVPYDVVQERKLGLGFLVVVAPAVGAVEVEEAVVVEVAEVGAPEPADGVGAGL